MYASNNSYPIQKLPLSEKTEEWRKACVNNICGRKNSNYMDKFNRKDLIQINEDLYDSILNEKDLELVTNPYKVDEGFPVTMQNVNVVRPKIDLLIGEESKKPDNFTIIETNDAAFSMVMEAKKEMLMEYITQEIEASLSPEQAQANAENGQRIDPKMIEDYISKSYKSMGEKTANALLNYLKLKLNVRNEFLKGWKDALIKGEEIYYTGIHNGEPLFERINPVYCDFDKRPDLECIEDGDWFLRHFRMSPASIYDRFFDIMTEDDLDQLNKMADSNYTSASGGYVNYTSPISYSVNNIKETLLDVFHAVWKSQKKIYYLTQLDENGQKNTTIVDETYIKQDGDILESDWVIEVWEGYKIGQDMYVGMGPVEYQHISIDNPNSKKLPYSGVIYGKSLMSLMKPLQYLYIILWYRLELALSRDKGKAFIMDITQVPKSMGMEPDKWLHYLTALGIAFVNPYEEGWDIPGREGGKAAQFNQFQSLDLTMSNVIAGYIQLMDKIEYMIGEISGVSAQRQGSISSNELVGNVERSVVQSANITEPWFWKHNLAKRNAYTNLLNAAKHAYATNGFKKLHFVLDDGSRIFLEVTEDFLYSDFDIFVSDATKEFQRLESLKTLLQPAMQSGASLFEAAEIITSDNISAIKNKLKEIDQRKQEIEQQQQQQQAEMSQQQIQAQQQMHAEEMQYKREADKLKSDTSIEVAMISANSANKDLNDNGIADVLEMNKFDLDRQKFAHQANIDNQELSLKNKTIQEAAEKRKSDAQLKEKEIEVKRIAANKPKAASK